MTALRKCCPKPLVIVAYPHKDVWRCLLPVLRTHLLLSAVRDAMEHQNRDPQLRMGVYLFHQGAK